MLEEEELDEDEEELEEEELDDEFEEGMWLATSAVVVITSKDGEGKNVVCSCAEREWEEVRIRAARVVGKMVVVGRRRAKLAGVLTGIINAERRSG